MSTNSVTAPKRPPVSAAEHADKAMWFARAVRRRRQALSLSVQHAAELSGMKASEWYALEAGWIPSVESGLLDAIAGTLQYCHFAVPVLAEISRYNQELLCASQAPLAC